LYRRARRSAGAIRFPTQTPGD